MPTETKAKVHPDYHAQSAPEREKRSSCLRGRRESHSAPGKLAQHGAQVLDYRLAIESVARDDLASLVGSEALPRLFAQDLGPDKERVPSARLPIGWAMFLLENIGKFRELAYDLAGVLSPQRRRHADDERAATDEGDAISTDVVVPVPDDDVRRAQALRFHHYLFSLDDGRATCPPTTVRL